MLIITMLGPVLNLLMSYAILRNRRLRTPRYIFLAVWLVSDAVYFFLPQLTDVDFGLVNLVEADCIVTSIDYCTFTIFQLAGSALVLEWYLANYCPKGMRLLKRHYATGVVAMLVVPPLYFLHEGVSCLISGETFVPISAGILVFMCVVFALFAQVQAVVTCGKTKGGWMLFVTNAFIVPWCLRYVTIIIIFIFFFKMVKIFFFCKVNPSPFGKLSLALQKQFQNFQQNIGHICYFSP